MATKKHPDAAKDKAMVKKLVHKHEKAKHTGKPLTKLAKCGTPNKTMKGR